MTVGPMGNTAGLSGSQNDAASALRKSQSDQKAQRAEGLGAADADNETGERDADGRRLWEFAEEEAAIDETTEEPASSGPSRQSKDATGESGGLLDLTG